MRRLDIVVGAAHDDYRGRDGTRRTVRRAGVRRTATGRRRRRTPRCSARRSRRAGRTGRPGRGAAAAAACAPAGGGAAAAAPLMLPAYCRVNAILRPSADSEIEMEAWMPAEW